MENSDDQYRVVEDGSVWTMDGKLVNIGGVQGLLRYLNVVNFATIDIKKSSNDNYDNRFVTEINKGYDKHKSSHYFQDHEKNNDKFCDESTKDQSLRCYNAFLATYYYEQIISTTSAPSYEVLIDGEGVVYHIYEDGVVTDSEGNIICQKGGKDCLYDYLEDKYDTLNPDVEATEQPSQTGTVSIFYYKYTDKTGVAYLYYLNGTLVNTKTGERKDGANAIKTLQDSLTLTGESSTSQKISYKLVTIKGYDDKHEDNALYSIWSDGSIWYNFKYFVDFGTANDLEDIIDLKKNLKSTQTDREIYVTEIDETFTIKYNPDRLSNGNGEEICRKNGFDGLYHCLLAYLTENHYDDIVAVIFPVEYERYIIDGVEYKVYSEGTVTDTTGSLITYDGVSGLIEYLINQARPVRYFSDQDINFQENVLVYKDSANKEYHQYGTGNLVDAVTGADANHLLP